MNKNKFRIYSEIEVKRREFDAKIYFATKAAHQGFSVVIGKKSAMFDNRRNFQKGLYLKKSLGPNHIKQIKEFKKLGFIVGAIDEEGLMMTSEKEYCESRFSHNLELVDIFFCWGEKEYNAIINNYSKFKNKLFITGNPRVDILKKQVNNNFATKAYEIKKKHGNFILYTSMFTNFNQHTSPVFDEDLDINEHHSIKILIAQGWDENGTRIKFLKNWLLFQKENWKIVMDFLNNFPTNFPDKKLLIRPHPNENIDVWKNVTKKLDNVEIVFDQESTCSWIMASEFLISSNCTTAVESYLLNKKPINFAPGFLNEVQYDEPKIVSKNVLSTKEMNETIRNYNPNYEKNEKEKIDQKISKTLFNHKEICSVETMIKHLKDKKYTELKSEKDKYVNFFSFYYFQFYYWIRFYYRKFFTKQNPRLIQLINQKLKRIDLFEVEELVEHYKSSLGIQHSKIVCKEIYPQLFRIEKKD